MEFALSDDQTMLQSSVRGALAQAATLDQVRAVAAGDSGAGAGVTATLADIGVPSILVPDAHCGLGLGLLEACLVAEAMGASAAPGGCLGNMVAAVAISLAGTEAQKTDWLPRIASGEAIFALALAERTGARDGAG
ncbi:MAG: acyl-CoA dehydrogenase family protein, partial [Pseudomonadota bacterium]